MEVRFSFRKAAVARRNLKLEDVHQTIKSLFAVHGLPCVSDGETLAFKDKSHGDDFAIMWDIILSLLQAGWFMDCAASCVWQDESGEEDLLAQAGKVRNTMRQCSAKKLPPPSKFQSTYRLEKAPLSAGLKPSPPGAERTQASRFDVKTPLAGDIP